MQNDELLPVTEADRDLFCFARGLGADDQLAQIASGSYDGEKLMQRIARHRTAHSGEGRDYAEAFDILVDVQSALAMTAEYSDGATVASFVSSSTQYERLNRFLHERQNADPRPDGEGRSNGAGDAREAMLQTARDLRENANGDCSAIEQAIAWERRAATPSALQCEVERLREALERLVKLASYC